MSDFNSKDRERLESIAATLDNHSPECYCGERGCTPETPKCSGNEMAWAINQIRELAYPTVTTRHPQRLINAAETIYFRAAQCLAERKPGINGGASTLAHILNRDFACHPLPPTDAEAEVIGTFCQWLGTNCGQSFLMECERAIEKERAEASKWHMVYGVPWSRFSSSWSKSHAERMVLREIPESEAAKRAVGDVEYGLRQLMSVLAMRTGALSADEASEALGVSTESFMRVYDEAMKQTKNFADDVKAQTAEKVKASA